MWGVLGVGKGFCENRNGEMYIVDRSDEGTFASFGCLAILGFARLFGYTHNAITFVHFLIDVLSFRV